MRLFDATTGALKKVLDFSIQRHGVLAANVANKDTPGYKATDLPFQEALRDAMGDDVSDRVTLKATDARHFGAGGVEGARPETVRRPALSFRPDGNTVDLDQEMTALSANAMTHTTAVQLLTKKLAMLRAAVTDGGR
ncbi:MAG: flagellar basal body rod protein FlgB [Myxococcales bacterium]|nr:flagellar basal body rod protein FlgB [Myxococcales bacterium]